MSMDAGWMDTQGLLTPVIEASVEISRAAASPRRMQASTHDFRDLVLDTRPVLARIAKRLCGNTDDACDLVQDTFERAARQGIPPDVRNPLAWLTAILRNRFIDRRRRDARRPPHESLGDSVPPITDEPTREPVWASLGVDDVRMAVDELDPIYRDVFVQHVFEHASYEALAARFMIERITVGTRLNRARKRLRVVLLGRLARNGGASHRHASAA